MAEWITRPIAAYCPNAEVCLDAFSRRQAGHRRARRDPPRGLEPGPPIRAARPRPRAQGRPLCALEEPREPDLPPARQARPHPARQPAPVPRLPAQRTAAPDLPPRGRPSARRPRRLAAMGAALPPHAVCQARPHDPPPPRRHRGRATPHPQQRSHRADQHANPADHPPRLRLSLTTRRDRPRHAVTRGPLPTPTRPMTRPTEPTVGSNFSTYSTV